MSRPTIALAMMDGLLAHAFDPEHLDRLRQAGELLDPVPMTRFDDERATELLAGAEVLVGHWGCPTLTDEVMAMAPKLRLFAYAAGTVKWQVTDAVWRRGVAVTSAAVANAVPVAEYATGAILLAGKGVFLFAAGSANLMPGCRSTRSPWATTTVGWAWSARRSSAERWSSSCARPTSTWPSPIPT